MFRKMQNNQPRPKILGLLLVMWLWIIVIAFANLSRRHLDRCFSQESIVTLNNLIFRCVYERINLANPVC